MPRKHRSGRERPSAGSFRVPTGPAPEWAQLEDHSVRGATGDKIYRCPGCRRDVVAGLLHLVVVPDSDPSERRHWHTNCWRIHLRKGGNRRV